MKKIYNDVISTGMTGLDALLEGGFRKGNLNVIAAGPGMGKTTFAMQFAAYIAKSGKRVCFFSLEMPNYQVKERLAKQGNADVPIIVDDASAITPKYIRKKLVTEEADVAIIDYIGLISPNKKRKISRIKEVSEIVFELKEIAKEFVDEEKGVYNEDGSINVNPNSLTVIKEAYVEPELEKYDKEDSFQFMRTGYFCLDSKDSTKEHMVFNRIVSLKSSYKPN